MNLNNNNDCFDFEELAVGSNASLPENKNGGLWIQPIKLPPQPRLKNVEDLGTLICTAEEFERNNTLCKLSSDNLNQKTFRIYSLFVRGPESQFEVSTSDDKKIILEIMGDIDISNEGKFCHRNGLEACGSGKAENLTILFKQKNDPESNLLICNRDNNDGGVKIKNNNSYSNLDYPIDNNLLPGSSFLIDNTGENFIEKFSAFIYAPKATFISKINNANYVQVTNESERYNNAGLVVATRGSYGYIRNTLGNTIEDKITNIILTPDLKLIPYGGSQENGALNNIEIVGIGQKISNLPTNSQFNQSAENVFLLFDKSSSNYHLRTYEIKNINSKNQSSLQNSYPGSFAILNPKNAQNDINLGNDLDNEFLSKPFLNSFGITIQRKMNNEIGRNFSGAAWVKNMCLDSNGSITWEFSRNFIDKLTAWHGSDFNWGRKFYRGKSIILWDTLREFR